MKKILIAEDEKSLAEALIVKLQDADFEVLWATNGEECLSLALENHPDLILMDIVMPKMDGMTALDRLRQDTWGKTASVIMLTNLSNAENVDKATNEGVFDYLIKSDWKLEDILEKIMEKLK